LIGCPENPERWLELQKSFCACGVLLEIPRKGVKTRLAAQFFLGVSRRGAEAQSLITLSRSDLHRIETV
jgi:hypothetical protein